MTKHFALVVSAQVAVVCLNAPAPGQWQQTGKITAADGAEGDRFAISVSVSGDTAVIGADWDDDNGRSSGSTYVFQYRCVGDLDGDGLRDLSDLAQLLAHYGTTSGATYEQDDVDGDGDVDLADLAALLAV